jgi:hypothetical protein
VDAEDMLKYEKRSITLRKVIFRAPKGGCEMNRKIWAIGLALTALSIFMSADAAKARVVKEGLVSYWTFDDIAGDTVKDAQGNNDGTIFGEPEIVEGRFGKALKFNHQDNYVEMPDSASLDGMSGITVSLWANVETLSSVAGTDQTFINKDAAGWGSRLYRIYLDSPTNTLHWRIGDGGGAYVAHPNGQTVLEKGEWYHITGISDENGALVYLNGVEDGVFAGAEVPDNDTTLRIGRAHTDGFGYVGVIDEVAIYNRALTEDEIEQNFAAEGFAVPNPAGKLAVTWAKIKKNRHW